MIARSFRLATGLLGLLLVGEDAHAFSPGPPKRHDVYSPNKAFVIDIDPDREMNTVYAATDRTRPLWSFPGHLWLCEVLLSNDGTVVAIVAWKYISEEVIPEALAISFQNKDGEFKFYTLLELCPNPKRTQEVGVGPIGNFWRTWYTAADNDGERFVLYTTGRYDYEFRFSDGQITDRSRLWVHVTRSRSEKNALPLGLACLYGFLMLLLTWGYWQRRREARRAASVASPPANPKGQ